MASRTITANGSKGHHKFTLTVTESGTSIANNTSTVSFSFTMSAITNSYDWNYTSKCVTAKCTINGSTYTKQIYKYGGSGSLALASGSLTVPHNPDGSKTISMSISVSDGIGASYTTGNASGSSTLTLTTLPRVSDLSLNKTTVPADGVTTVIATATKKSSAFTDTLAVKLGSYSKDITSGTAFTIPKDWINAITETSAVATVTVTTKTGTTVIGSKSAELTVTVPDDVKPTINSITASEAVSSVTSAFGNRFVKTLSQLNVSINASGIYGSTIKSYATSLDGVNYVGQAFNSNALNKAGSLEIKTTVTDSRGRKATLSKTINVVDYASPTITSMTYYPCDSAGKENSGGTYTKVLISGKVASVDSQNIKTLLLKYKATSGESYTVRSLTVPDWTFNVETIIANTDPSVTYEYIADLTDKIGTTSYAISTGVPVISRLAGGKGIRFFGECFQEGFMVGNIDYTITDEEYAELLKLLGVGS